MRSTKYYYSKPAFVKYMRTLIDGQGEVLFISEKEPGTKAKRVPRVCVASVYDRDNGIMQFGYAVCSPKDVFKKEVGRKLAYDRAINKPTKKVLIKPGSKVRMISTKYANEIIDNYIAKYIA